MDQEQIEQVILPIVIRRSYTAMAFWAVVVEVVYIFLIIVVAIIAFVFYQITSSVIFSMILIACVPILVSIFKVVFFIYGIINWMEISYVIESDLIKVKKGTQTQEYSLATLNVDAEQDFMGKILNYGTIVLILSSGKNVQLRYISHPYRYEKIIKKVKELISKSG